MKINKLLIIIACTLLSSCFNNKKNNDLIDCFNDIKAMGDTCPTAAIQRMDSMSNIIADESEYVKNKYDLLNIRLRDKAYITHTTDSVIKKVCKYFEKTGTTKEKQEAYYYMGSVYRDMHDSPNAVTYFLKAIALGEDYKEIDTTLFINSYLQLSGMYTLQINDSAALNSAICALNIANKINETDARLYMNVASCYFNMNDTANYMKYSKYALNQIIKEESEIVNADIIAKQMCDYAKLDHKDEADFCYSLLKQVPHNNLPHNYLINLAIYYNKCVNTDSAAIIYKDLYKSTDNISQIYNSSQQLAKYYYKKNDYRNAIFYAIEFIAANEAVIEQRKAEHTTNVNNIYNYNRKKEEFIRIEQKAEKNKLYLTIGIFAFIIIILFIIILFYHRKKKLLDVILNKEKEISNIQELINKRDNQIRNEKQKLSHKQKELKEKTDKNNELILQLQEAENSFKKLIAQNKELTRHIFMDNIPQENVHIIEKCKKTIIGKENFDDKDWKELLGVIDKQFPEFTNEIQVKFKKINEPMLRICYLLKIGLSNPQITNLTGYPPQTVWDRVKRIEKVLGYSFHQGTK